MIGSGHHVRLRLWNGDTLVHDGILPPGHDAALKFSGGPETVTHFAITRMTTAEVDGLGQPERSIVGQDFGDAV